MLFKEIAPIVILLTLVISALIAIRTKSSNVPTIDGVFAILGTVLGLLITFINLIYSNNYLITIGPILTAASLLYLKYRDKLLADEIDIKLSVSNQKMKIIRTIYWIFTLVALISFYQATPYSRPPIFFISISIAVGSLGLEILLRTYERNIQIYIIFFKILLISIILRSSAYFISPYPIGSDPWTHADLIKDISIYGTSYLPQLHGYYSNYPIMHICASIICTIGNLGTKEAMFIIGTILTFSTIFVYLIIERITNSVHLALFSMLLINFSDFHIQWSIQIIAMSFGLAIYAMAIYLLIEQKKRINALYKIFTILMISILIWTHTISSFIFIVSLISLYIGSYMYKFLYLTESKSAKLTVNATLCMFCILILVYHWIDPKYPFFDKVLEGLIASLSKEAEFLGRETVSNVSDSWFSIFDILGFLILVFFGVVGSLHSLSKENQTKTKVSLIFMLVVLFAIFFVFPVMGIRNIVPYRWPAFIYTTFVLFSGIGLFKIVNIIKYKSCKLILVFILLIVFSFFMITNSFTDMDSPVYGKNLNQKLIWTESEIEMYTHLNNCYDEIIVSDIQTREMPLQAYLNREKVADYLATPEGDLDWEYMGDKMIIWRKDSLERPVQVSSFNSPNVLLGYNFRYKLDSNFHSIYDSGSAKGYLGWKKDESQ